MASPLLTTLSLPTYSIIHSLILFLCKQLIHWYSCYTADIPGLFSSTGFCTMDSPLFYSFILAKPKELSSWQNCKMVWCTCNKLPRGVNAHTVTSLHPPKETLILTQMTQIQAVQCKSLLERLPDICCLRHRWLRDNFWGNEFWRPIFTELRLQGCDLLSKPKVTDLKVFPLRINHEDIQRLENEIK